MATNIGEIRAGVSNRIQDKKPVLSVSPDMTSGVDVQILAALGEYQVARPRQRTKLVTGTGSFYYALTGGSLILPAWADEFSLISRIIFPWDATSPTPHELDVDEYEVVQLDGDIPWLRFRDVTPSATEKFLIDYTTQHALDASQSTIPVADDEAFKDLSAAYCCDAIASAYSQSVDNSMSADSVNQLSKAQEYRANAKVFRASYKAKLQGDAPPSAAAAIVSIDTIFSDERSRRFFHGRRFR